MIIRCVTLSAFAAVCLTAIATLSGAHAQMGYWPPPGPYGLPPGAYGYGLPQGTYGYGLPQGPYGPPPSPYGLPRGAYGPRSRYVPPPAGTQVITNGPQTSPGDVSPSWSPQRNVAESAQYERLLKESPTFRQARMRKECGPITDPQLHRQCLNSFGQF